MSWVRAPFCCFYFTFVYKLLLFINFFVAYKKMRKLFACEF